MIIVFVFNYETINSIDVISTIRFGFAPGPSRIERSGVHRPRFFEIRMVCFVWAKNAGLNETNHVDEVARSILEQ
jgi:hypothetical protein